MRTIFAGVLSALLLTACGASGAKSGENNNQKIEKAMKTIHLTKAEFLDKVVNYEANPNEWKYLGDKPAIVDFYASWCGPCKMVAPILDELAQEYDGKIYVYKIDTEKEQELAAAFGIRNFQNLEQGLCEMWRVLRKGGHLCVIELTTPVAFPMRQLFSIYSHTVLPLYGRLISKDTKAYSYLTQTIEAFPQGEAMEQILRRAGFAEASFQRLTFGICTLYFATK